MIFKIFCVCIFALMFSFGFSKTFNKCTLAWVLKEKYGALVEDVGTYVCIAEHQSRLNTAVVNQGIYYGLFQISEEFWCDSSKSKGCNLNCKDLLDDDLEDDLQCVRRIIEEHRGISSDGYSSAWPASGKICQSLKSKYLEECHNEMKPMPHKRTHGKMTVGKIYERCELARELKYRYGIPSNDISTWICIVKHESNFNTSAIGRLNWDGSEDHGLFQISDLFWCSKEGRGKGCDMSCSDLEDSDISDDVECVKKIHEEHTRHFGNGFQAWNTYSKCQKQLDQFVTDCFSFNIQYIRPGVQQPSIPRITLNPTLIDETTTETIMLPETTSFHENIIQMELNFDTDNKIKSQSSRTNMKSSFTAKKSPTKSRFDISEFYPTDYTSKASVNFKPIMISKKTINTLTTTESPRHRIKNITPHSIEYLLKLTTPKNNL